MDGDFDIGIRYYLVRYKLNKIFNYNYNLVFTFILNSEKQLNSEEEIGLHLQLYQYKDYNAKII